MPLRDEERMGLEPVLEAMESRLLLSASLEQVTTDLGTFVAARAKKRTSWRGCSGARG